MNSDDSSSQSPRGDGKTERRIPELLDQELETSSEFMNRVRNKIHRRVATAQITAFSWHMPKIFLLELINALGELLSGSGGRKGE